MKRIDKIIAHPTFITTIKELKAREATRKYCIHDMEHLLNVARIMMIKNLEEHLNFEKELIYASAILHDIGKLSQYKTKEKHALIGSEIAHSILLECNFTAEETKMITQAIKTHSDNEPTNPLGELLRDCDKLSRNCFICSASNECKWSKKEKNRGITI